MKLSDATAIINDLLSAVTSGGPPNEEKLNSALDDLELITGAILAGEFGDEDTTKLEDNLAYVGLLCFASLQYLKTLEDSSTLPYCT